MKIIFFIIFNLLFIFSSYAQDVRDNRGRLNGRWNNSEYRDAQGRLVYRFDSSNDLRDHQGSLVMRYNNGDFRDSQGRLMGRLKNDEVRDAQGRLLGRINDNGEVRDAQGRLLGRAGGISKERAAIVYFFFS